MLSTLFSLIVFEDNSVSLKDKDEDINSSNHDNTCIAFPLESTVCAPRIYRVHKRTDTHIKDGWRRWSMNMRQCRQWSPMPGVTEHAMKWCRSVHQRQRQGMCHHCINFLLSTNKVELNNDYGDGTVIWDPATTRTVLIPHFVINSALHKFPEPEKMNVWSYSYDLTSGFLFPLVIPHPNLLNFVNWL